MKKTEYVGSHMPNAIEKRQELEAGKYDDYELPEFTKEVPVSSRKSESGGKVSIEYEWKSTSSPSIKVKKIDFRTGEDLSDFYKVQARDGADSISFKHRGKTYILRKTVREIAKALYNAYGKVKGVLENIVGYIRSVLGNDYVISKVEQESWSFDIRVAKGDIKYCDVDSLDKSSKCRLVELITEKIASLHSNNLIIGRFTLNNVLLNDSEMKLTDLRRLRVSRKRSYVLDEFKSILQYLYAIGIASKEDIYASAAYYASQNVKCSNEWYEDRTGNHASDELDIVNKIEEEIYS
jgi:hypothetical protein